MPIAAPADFKAKQTSISAFWLSVANSGKSSKKPQLHFTAARDQSPVLTDVQFHQTLPNILFYLCYSIQIVQKIIPLWSVVTTVAERETHSSPVRQIKLKRVGIVPAFPICAPVCLINCKILSANKKHFTLCY